MFLLVIPNEVRNPSGFQSLLKEGFLTRRSGFGMTARFFFFATWGRP
jgi:hypothetical protein